LVSQPAEQVDPVHNKVDASMAEELASQNQNQDVLMAEKQPEVQINNDEQNEPEIVQVATE